MFGYVVANGKLLSDEQLKRYRGCYCGLCRALGSRHGQLSRLTLNYDMTFLVMLLTAMYEPEESAGRGRCLPHPAHERDYWQSKYTFYAADMNIALAYHNCIDDWQDDKNVAGLAEAGLLKRSYADVKARWPRQCAAIEENIARLGEIEKGTEKGPDAAAECFAGIMGALFSPEEDSVWGGALESFGKSLGRFIYMMDACVDYEKDMKKGRFNPLASMACQDLEGEMTPMLKMLIGDAARIFETLPIVTDADILRNVLYSGVWTQYAAAKRKGKEAGESDK